MGGVVEGLERELGAKVSGHRISLLIISSIKCPLFRRKTPRIFQRRGEKFRRKRAIGLAGGPKMNHPGRMGRRFVKRLLERKRS